MGTYDLQLVNLEPRYAAWNTHIRTCNNEINISTLLRFRYLLSTTYLLTYFSFLLTYLLTYLLTNLLTYLLTPLSKVLVVTLTGSQLVKKFPTFHGT